MNLTLYIDALKKGNKQKQSKSQFFFSFLMKFQFSDDFYEFFGYFKIILVIVLEEFEGFYNFYAKLVRV